MSAIKGFPLKEGSWLPRDRQRRSREKVYCLPLVLIKYLLQRWRKRRFSDPHPGGSMGQRQVCSTASPQPRWLRPPAWSSCCDAAWWFEAGCSHLDSSGQDFGSSTVENPGRERIRSSAQGTPTLTSENSRGLGDNQALNHNPCVSRAQRTSVVYPGAHGNQTQASWHSLP